MGIKNVEVENRFSVDFSYRFSMAKEVDKEIHISLADQQKINKFARHNSRLEDFKEDHKNKKNEIKTLEDASSDLEIMFLEGDSDVKVQYQIGEVFVYLNEEEAEEEIKAAKEKLESGVVELEGKMTEIKDAMTDLKTQLYAKFGNAINLEADDE